MLNFFIWLILIFLLFRIIFRYVFPYLLAWYLKKRKGFSAEDFMNYNNGKNKKEGEITIKQTQENKAKGFSDGEYIDYEEIDDNKFKKK
jgi:hypothetical protein